MANRINGNVIIVDSAMGNNFVLTSANLVLNLDEFKVGAVSFFMLNTSASVILTQADTSLDVIYTANLMPYGVGLGSTVLISNPQTIQFPGGFRASNLKVPTLTAGTAYLYLV